MSSNPDRSFLRAGLLVAAIALTGCPAATEDPTPSDVAPSGAASAGPSAPSAPPTASTGAAGEGEETSVFDLEVGDCFSVESDELVTVAVVDCEQAHEYEVFAHLEHEAGAADPYPGDDPMLEYGDTACQTPFVEYVGRDYQTSIWFITSLVPSEQTWVEGDREIVCTLNQQDANSEPIAVTGSAEGSGE